MGEIVALTKHEIAEYIETWQASGVLGRLEYWKNVQSTHLSLPRHVEIWLPPGYDESPEARYPVLYMHDGQNLFDPRLSYTRVDWGIDEAIVRGVQAGRAVPAIVVGVWCTEQRVYEFSPWHLGPQYARFLIEELMPAVNRQFRTLTGPANTFVMGSSMGGLITFWLCWNYPQVFSRGGCVSTHWTWSGPEHNLNNPPLFERELARGAPFPRGVRLYFDYGTRGIDAPYEPLQAKVTAWLIAQGLHEGKDFVVRKFAGADHNETSWRARLDEPVAFLLGSA